MAVPMFKNNANTILASNITNSQTTLPVNTGTGALFLSPPAGDYFMVTVISASNPAVFEVMQCTARSGDTLTVVRAQEGTTAMAFNASDVVAQLWTSRDVIDNRTQRNMSTASGTANAQVIANSTPISAFVKGLVQRWIPTISNTTAATAAIDGNAATALRAFGQPLIGGELQVGVPIEGDYDGTVIHLANPLITALGLANGALEVTLVTANGNFTPKTTSNYLVIAIGGGGGGGGGGGSGASVCGRHGTGGEQGQMVFSIQALTAGTPYPNVIGTGGAFGGGGSASGAGSNGSPGTDTTFNGAAVTATHGVGGIAGVVSSTDTSRGYTGTGGIGPGGGQGGAGGASSNPGSAGANATGTVGAGGGGGGGGGSGASGSAGGNGGNGAPGMVIIIRA